MKFQETKLKGCYLIDLDKNEDQRGSLNRIFCQKTLLPLLKNKSIRQINRTFTRKEGVVRGLHFQNPPFAQGKLVRVIKGSVLDISVDIRKDSITYGQHFAFELNEENKSMLFIPPGFAHGFLTLADNTIFFYKCTNYYNKASEDTLLWNDNTLNIDWKIENPIISEKDKEGKAFHSFVSLF